VSATVTDFQSYDANTALAWQRGQLIYNDVRLDELLADLSRYLPKKMVLSGRASSDDKLFDKHVSAVLFLDDQDAMLEALSKSLPIQWQDVSDKLIIISPNT
jgi:transmembrane sensor